MRAVRIRKGIGAIVIIGVLLACMCLHHIGLYETTHYHIHAALNSKKALINDVKVIGSKNRASGALGRGVMAEPVKAIRSKRPQTSCQPIKNVAFIKTHKAGSSTIANILQRFGITHNLNFALPRRKINTYGFNYIVRPGDVFTANRLIPLPPGQEYNILWSHSIYNKTGFHQVLPDNTAYISILREPFQQFVSSFEYYGFAKSIDKKYTMNSTNPISTFITSPTLTRLFVGKGHYGYIRSKQAQDLGFREMEFMNESSRVAMLDDIERDFSFIMIMEHFDESLLILKHKLCWDMKDILYIPKNINPNKPNRAFTEEDHEKHREYSPMDYVLYSRFIGIYNNIIKKKDDDFFKELAHYKTILKQVKKNCLFKRPFSVPETPWHKAFKVDINDCKMMIMSELDGLRILLAQMKPLVPCANGKSLTFLNKTWTCQ